mmetsp:Transcript_43420/g.130235  ORF Transcript_43420/g.130235 Transcript_43420/m.130235 type:complete len:292 (-) Transcript_43420:300-1175(-)
MGKLYDGAVEFAVCGTSVGVATCLTNPFDVVKTRLQLQRLKCEKGGGKPPGLIRTGINCVQQEGMLVMWSGLTPALVRGFTYGGIRLGLYTPLKGMIANAGSDGQVNQTLGGKLAAGSISGSIASAITNPTELVKTRLQDRSNKHKGSLAVIRHVIATEGISGLWGGVGPGVARAALVTACQCGTYDEFKRLVLLRTGWGECVSTHLTASMMAGFVATTVTNPVDVIKTVVFTGGKEIGGPLAAAANILKTDGPTGFFKGWTANFTRLGPQTVFTFLATEQIRSMLGMKNF